MLGETLGKLCGSWSVPAASARTLPGSPTMALFRGVLSIVKAEGHAVTAAVGTLFGFGKRAMVSQL